MKTLYSLTLLLLVLLLSSCSSPLEKEFNRETAEADFTRIVQLNLIDSTDAFIMSHFMVEHDLIGAQVLELGATYQDILTESKIFWEKSQRTGGSAEASIVNEDLVKDLIVSMQPLGEVQESEWSHGIKYKLSMENTSGKSVKAVKGNFAFFDPFGDRVYSIEYKYLDAIENGEKITREITLRIQNTSSSQQMLEYGKTNPFTIRWEPVSILYK